MLEFDQPIAVPVTLPQGGLLHWGESLVELARQVHYHNRGDGKVNHSSTEELVMADLKDRMKGGIDNGAEAAKNATDKVANAASGAKQEATGLVDRLKDKASNLVDKAGESAGQVRHKVNELVGDAGDAARHAGNKVAEWAGDAYDATTEKVNDFGREVTNLIRNHPLPAVLIGFGLGMLFSRATRIV